MPPDGFFATLKASIDTMAAFTPAQQRARLLLDGEQRYSCLVGGSRAGKTFVIIWVILDTAVRAPGSRHAVLRFRANAARTSISLDTLPKVARLCFPTVRIVEHRQDGYFELENGSQIWVGGLDDRDRVEKILGQEYTTIFLNEASQIPYASALIAWTRLAQVVPGCKQRGIVDLNPGERSHWTNMLFGEKKDPVSRQSLPDPSNYARLFLNPTDNKANLSADYLATLAAMPSRMRKRFYEGAYVEQLEGALWKSEMIDDNRRAPQDVPDLKRVVVAVDPSGGGGDGNDEAGIVCVGHGVDDHFYVLEDASGRFGPVAWAQKAVELFRARQADRIVAETNFGAGMVEATIRNIDPNIPFTAVHASRGKIVRAEPCAALYEKGKVHHVGALLELEEQMTSFTAASTGSPDRMDALVWALTFLSPVASNDGMIVYYERMATEQTSPRPAAPDDLVRCRAPRPGTFYLITGRSVQVGDDLAVDLTAAEAKPMRAAGWTVPPLPEEADHGR